jgi:RNA polymerase sigma factor (sigma-70 family)
MYGRQLFEANLDEIEHAIAFVCRQVRLHGADAEDFASTARLALLANDCAILNKYEGRSSLGGYVAVVVRRLFLSQKRDQGRWYPSAEAERRGPAAVMLERLLVRGRMTLAEAVADTKQQHPDADARELEASAAAFPQRPPRPHLVPVADDHEERIGGGAPADARVHDAELERASLRASQAVRTAFDAMTAQDRVVLRLRFGKGATVADIARALGVAQRPLYRRIEALLADLRKTLERSGIAAADAADLVEAAAGERLDFGLDEGKVMETP